MTIKVTIQTDLLNSEDWNKAIKKAGRGIRPNAVRELQTYTPVDTGLLTSQWKVKSSKLGIHINNTTPYAAFINDGTVRIKPRRMVEKATPKILDDYEKAILDNIERIQ